MNRLQNYIEETVRRKCNEHWGRDPKTPFIMPAEVQFLLEVVAEELDNLHQRCENLESLCNP